MHEFDKYTCTCKSTVIFFSFMKPCLLFQTSRRRSRKRCCCSKTTTMTSSWRMVARTNAAAAWTVDSTGSTNSSRLDQVMLLHTAIFIQLYLIWQHVRTCTCIYSPKTRTKVSLSDEMWSAYQSRVAIKPKFENLCTE